MVQMNQEEVLLADQEFEEMLRKGAIQRVQLSPDQFLRSIFVIPKQDTGHCQMIINIYHTTTSEWKVCFFEGDSAERGLQVQDRSQGCLFFSTLHLESQKFVRFLWKGQLFQFLCLWFGPSVCSHSV